MALSISKMETVYHLSGALHANQVFQLRNFFELSLKNEESITISLAGLDDLDLSAALMFKQLKDEAYKMKKSVTVFNGENQKILGPFLMLEDQQVLTAA